MSILFVAAKKIENCVGSPRGLIFAWIFISFNAKISTAALLCAQTNIRKRRETSLPNTSCKVKLTMSRDFPVPGGPSTNDTAGVCVRHWLYIDCSTCVCSLFSWSCNDESSSRPWCSVWNSGRDNENWAFRCTYIATISPNWKFRWLFNRFPSQWIQNVLFHRRISQRVNRAE